MTTKTVAPSPEVATINIQRIGTETLLVPIVGLTPLIVHRFSEKAKQTMLDRQQGKKTPKTTRDPEAEYEAAFYRLDGERYGFPVVAFKDASISGARYYGKDVTMVGLRQYLFFHGELGDGANRQQLAEIQGTPRMREDVVRLNRSSTDLRYRPEFSDWTTTLKITYVTSALTRDSLLSLVDAGGLGVGVGEWRPERGGEFGTYTIDESRTIEIMEGR